MKPVALAALLLALAPHVLAAGASLQAGYVEGQPLAAIDFIDDEGRVRSTNEWRGAPAIIAPIYTRCPVACPLIVEGLKRGLDSAKARPGTYRVILFSFDPRDTPADLHRFRERHHVPMAWTVASAGAPAIRSLMDSIGFHYAETGNAFRHPNVVIAIAPDLTTAKYLFGTDYSASDIDQALAMARGDSRWLDRSEGVILALLLFACVMSIIYLFQVRINPQAKGETS